nr:hypothetical protein [Nannocystis sp.]
MPATAARGRGEHPCAGQRLERSDGVEFYRAVQALRIGQQATGTTVPGPRCGRLGQAEQFVILAAPGAARVADLVGDQFRVDLQAGWGDLDDVRADADTIALAEDGGLMDAAMVDRGAEWRGAVIDDEPVAPAADDAAVLGRDVGVVEDELRVASAADLEA